MVYRVRMLAFLMSIGFYVHCYAQDNMELLDRNAYKKWYSIDHSPILSNDGKFVIYRIQNLPLNSQTLVVTATDKQWKKEYEGSIFGAFSGDSKTAIISQNDSLFTLKLGTEETNPIGKVKTFRLSNGERNSNWIAYEPLSTTNNLVLKNLLNNRERKFNHVQKYQFSDGGEILLLQVPINPNANSEVDVKLIELKTGSIFSIWKGKTINRFIFDGLKKQFVFEIDTIINSELQKEIWYYKLGEDHASSLANIHSKGLDSSLKIENIQRFSNNGERIFITIREKKMSKNPILNLEYPKVDVWSYKDAKLQPTQLKELGLGPKSYSAVILIETKSILQLQNEGEDWRPRPGNDEWVYVSKNNLLPGDLNRDTHYLVSTQNGTRKDILGFGDISPDGKYVVYYDSDSQNYFSYQIANGHKKNITSRIVWGSDQIKDADVFNRIKSRRDIAGWIKGEEKVLIYDQYDIWKVDLTGNTEPSCLTNNFGYKNHIVFNLIPTDKEVINVSNNEKLILCAFNKDDKTNGFYSKVTNEEGDPKKLCMESSLFWNPSGNIGVIKGTPPLSKSESSGIYLLRKMKADESPNYYITKDFKTMKSISNVNPESKYNWLKTELYTWKNENGEKLQGLLYKPTNFDPKKKYPVIFYYYRKLSDNLNAYLEPEPICSGCSINIPSYVSNGYLVFAPDITYALGKPGAGALSSIVSAAHSLSKLPYINSDKMGINGCSFGGFQTNYLLTHTNIFAAAVSASGLYDFISAYNSVNNGKSKQMQFEAGPYQIGSTLWEDPQLFIENSAIFNANKVTTPFLMMHTTGDGTVPFANAVEFFTGLRRLGKKVWMLQYDGDHGVFGNEAIDFDLRMRQFFDHYLKDAPPPKWMTLGRPARLKGIDECLDLDTTGIVP